MSEANGLLNDVKKEAVKAGPWAVLAFLIIFWFGEKIDNHTEAVNKLVSKIEVLLDRNHGTGEDPGREE